ncbi:hypothetical protein V8B97DRAFT_968958 [Scleroderma yunnanense]
MGRWTQYDEDSYRLPEGMSRIGYDADTQRYLFSDSFGRLYQNAPGERYGVLKPVPSPIPPPPRRSATVVAHYDPPLSEKRSKKLARAKTFHAVLPPSNITSAPPPPTSEHDPTPEGDKMMKYAMLTSQRVFANIKRRCSDSLPSYHSLPVLHSR